MSENKGVVQNESIDNLNQKLFAQLSRLEIAIGEEEIKCEVTRTAALVKVANALISAGKVALLAYEIVGGNKSKLPRLVRLEEPNSDTNYKRRY